MKEVFGVIEEPCALKSGSVCIDSNLKDMGVDSLDLMEVILEVEDVLGIEIYESELSDCYSVSHLVNLVERAKQNRGNGKFGKV